MGETFASGVPGSEPDLVFYDGGCGLCHRSVRFLLDRDRSGDLFRYAPLGGETFRRRLGDVEPAVAGPPETLIVLTGDGGVLRRSTAVLHALGRIGRGWRFLAAVASVVPRPLRDLVYRAVARIRHRLFRRPSDTCPVMAPELRARFAP